VLALVDVNQPEIVHPYPGNPQGNQGIYKNHGAKIRFWGIGRGMC
jgi:hypothetical protein